MGALYSQKETSPETDIVRPRSYMKAVTRLLALLSGSLAKQHIYLWLPQRTLRWEFNWKKKEILASESSVEQSPKNCVSSVVLHAFSKRLSSPGAWHSRLWTALLISQRPIPGPPVHSGRKWMCVPVSARRAWPLLCLWGTKADCSLVSGLPHHCLQGPKDFSKVGLLRTDEFFLLLQLPTFPLFSFFPVKPPSWWPTATLSEVVKVNLDPYIN